MSSNRFKLSEITWVHHLQREESLTGFLLREELQFVADHSSDLLCKIDGEFKLRNFPTNGCIEGKSNFEKQLVQNTIYPLYKYTTEYDFKSELIRRCNQDSPYLHSEQFMKKVFDWKEIMFCPKCFFEQIKHHGFCWLLREWQAPLVTACYFHKIKLCKSTCDCSIYKLSKKNFIVGLFIGLCPVCHCRTWQDKYNIATLTEQKTSEWMSKLLKFPPIHLSRAVHLSLVMDMIQRKGLIDFWDENQLSLFFKCSLKRQRSVEWRRVHSKNKNYFKDFKLPVDLTVFYSLVTYSFDSASDFYSHINTCGLVGYLDVTAQKDQLDDSKQLVNVDEELIQDSEPESMHEDWIRLIV